MEQGKLLSKKKGYSIFAILGTLCAFLWKAVNDLAINGNILWTGSYVLGILTFSVLIGALTGMILCYLIYGLCEHRWAKKAGKIQETIHRWTVKLPMGKRGFGLSGVELKPGTVFLGSFLLVFVCWLPCYLAYFPGICSYDTIVQLEQIVKNAYIDHHPIMHTLLLKWAIQFGNTVCGNATIGVGVYVALQAILVAMSFAYSVSVLAHLKVSKWWILLTQLFAMFYPFHWYMSVTTTKDTLFSAFFLVQMVSLYGWIIKKERGLSLFAIMTILSTALMIVFRNNGKYAMLVLVFFLLLAVVFGKHSRKHWSVLLGVSLMGFAIGVLVLLGLSKMTNATQGDKREMLSMPIQQLARTMVYHGGIGRIPSDEDGISVEEKAVIDEFLLNESYKLYRPDISDPVKRNANTYVVRYRTKEFLSTYLGLLCRYPGDYINAALAVNAGFLSPGDETHASINETEGLKGMGYVQTHWAESVLAQQGIYKDSKWQSLHQFLERWADENAYLDIPVLKYLFVPGTVLWAYLILFGTILIKRQYHRLMPLSLVLGYYGTLLLGPTVQLRYIYPLMVVLPFLWALSLHEKIEKRV